MIIQEAIPKGELVAHDGRRSLSAYADMAGVASRDLFPGEDVEITPLLEWWSWGHANGWLTNSALPIYGTNFNG